MEFKMNAIDLKRAEFRQYLESTGVMDALSYALIKLYDEHVKPSDPVTFVRQHFKRPNDENAAVDISTKRIEDMDAAELIQKQQHELDMARQEIVKLRQTLNAMADNSPPLESLERALAPEPISYQSIFDDSKYDATLVKKYLTEDMYGSLTENDDRPSIVDCIVKVDALETYPVGVIALNGDCYTKFADLYESIIKEIHGIDAIERHPDSNWGDGNAFEQLSCENIVSIEISCSRSLAGIPFIPGMNEHDLESVLTKVQNAIQSTRTDDQEIDGEFYKITDVKENEPIFEDLLKTGLGFQSMLPNDHRSWPIGRGLYINCARTQSILINEEEHLRFVSKEMSNDFGSVYRNLITLIQKFGNGLSFERSEKLGWLTTNLNSLGPALSCRVKIKLRKTAVECIKEICQKNRIKINLVEEDDEGNEQIIELVNQSRFGFSEFECVNMFYEQLKTIMKMMDQQDDVTEQQHDTNNEPIPPNSDNVEDVVTEITECESKQNETEAPDNFEQPEAVNNENSEQMETKTDESTQNEPLDDQSDKENNEQSAEPEVNETEVENNESAENAEQDQDPAEDANNKENENENENENQNDNEIQNENENNETALQTENLN